MPLPQATRLWCLLAILAMALSLAPSYAHLLEAGPRITIWSPELWRETTVFNGQFKWFAIVGGPLDVGAIVVGAVLTFVLREEKVALRWALAATVLFAVSLAIWLSVVAPANAELATWQPGPIPSDFVSVRNRWETGHIVMAATKCLGLAAAVMAALATGRTPQAVS